MSDETNQTEQQQTPVIKWDINKAAIAEAAEELKDIDAYVDLPAAQKAKKKLTKMRTTLAEAHKETKAEALAFGRKVDAKKNEYLELIKKIEDPISIQLSEIKQKAEREEEDRKAAISAQIDRLAAYAEDRHSLTLDEMKERRENLMAEDLTSDDAVAIYQEALEEATMARDEAELKLRLAIDREKTRIEEEAAQAAQAAENERRQKELDERQAKMDQDEAERQASRDVEEADRKAAQKVLDDAAAAKLVEENAARQADLDEQAEKNRKAQKLIDDENERIAQEAADKEAEELQAQEEAENEAALLAAAPDVEKLEAYANSLALLTTPDTETEAGCRVRVLAVEKLLAVIEYIRNETRKMK